VTAQKSELVSIKFYSIFSLPHLVQDFSGTVASHNDNIEEQATLFVQSFCLAPTPPPKLLNYLAEPLFSLCSLSMEDEGREGE
jgi:hypothetical protein